MLCLNELRREFAEHLISNTDVKFSSDAALFHVCKVAYDQAVKETEDRYKQKEKEVNDAI